MLLTIGTTVEGHRFHVVFVGGVASLSTEQLYEGVHHSIVVAIVQVEKPKKSSVT